MFIEWDSTRYNEFLHRFILITDCERNLSVSELYKMHERKDLKPSDKQKAYLEEIEKRKLWILENCAGPVMLAMGGKTVCFQNENDAMAFKLRWR